ncbi:DUF2244 domain-containing protein [Pseudaestuariivita atlantica]|uniref:Integral membrane protein n=1 Tax=Pseudaestuariivita atlantica TaxID=1317121 RepID=A0A0L1JN06_9RHOB|nr:DUF2244 domain-containing protein [Pseudaestuariivita atlantica]KNG93134.1 integral membrane protein [Pseudaestuariivita atlantica]
MPYRWSDTADPTPTLTLWPHRSLPRAGFAAVVLGCFTAITLPLYGLLGTVLLWGLLPFLLMAVGALWWGLEASYRSGEIEERLVFTDPDLHLTRRNPKGDTQEWQCNAYWARATLHPKGGPVPNYVTLSGNGREVEIGAFLSEDERKALYLDLDHRLRGMHLG